MAYAGKNWPRVHSANILRYAFDFRDRLSAGDSIATVAWTLEVAPDTVYRLDDPDPASHLGDDGVDGTVVAVRVGGLLAGVRYRLAATITTTLGGDDDLYAHVQCDPGP